MNYSSDPPIEPPAIRKDWPVQGWPVGRRVVVSHDYSNEEEEGTVLRADTEEPGRMIIRLDSGKVVLSTECLWAPVSKIDPLKAYPDDPTKADIHHPFTAYNQGHDAQQAGHPYRLNPYPVGSREHESWSNGWTDAVAPPSPRHVLLLASYCGPDDKGCSDALPCPACIQLCNVALVEVKIFENQGGWAYRRREKHLRVNHTEKVRRRMKLR